jgi:hypothetical protein
LGGKEVTEETMVPPAGIEPATPSLPMKCSTTEPRRRWHWIAHRNPDVNGEKSVKSGQRVAEIRHCPSFTKGQTSEFE